tara:strand:- start:71 stop:256 length:186 start_codon:yes stop_codon:yes gene_type:complete
MTKKHFIKIAKILKNQRTFIENVNSEGFEKRIINSIETELIEIFTSDNPQFDIERFKQASR